jgi:hypothetical protein
MIEHVLRTSKGKVHTEHALKFCSTPVALLATGSAFIAPGVLTRVGHKKTPAEAFALAA